MLMMSQKRNRLLPGKCCNLMAEETSLKFLKSSTNYIVVKYSGSEGVLELQKPKIMGLNYAEKLDVNP